MNEKNMKPLVKDTGNGHLVVKKGFAYALTSLFVLALGASWSFTWNAASDRMILIKSLESHISNSYIHNMSDTHITEKDLTLYFEPIIQRLDRIDKSIDKLNNNE